MSRLPGHTRSSSAGQITLLMEELAAESLGASATASIFPNELKEPVAAGERLIVLGAVRRGPQLAKHPRAFVAGFSSGGIVPAAGVRIGDRFGDFMRHHRSHGVRAGIVIRTYGLRRARSRTAIAVADERILDVRTCDGRMRVPTAIPHAKTRGLLYIGGR